MSKIFAIVRIHFSFLLFSPSTYASICLILSCCLIGILPIHDYALQNNVTIQLAEPSILLGTDNLIWIFLSAGMILLLSGLPSLGQNTDYMILRSSNRKTWYIGQWLFIFFAITLYHLLAYLVATVFCIDRIYLADIWSKTLIYLTKGAILPNGNAVSTMPSMIRAISPIQAAAHSLLLMILYFQILSLLMYSINMLSKSKLGYGIIFGLHLSFNVIHLVGQRSFYKYSPIYNIMVDKHNFGLNYYLPSLHNSYIVLIILLFIVTAFSFSVFNKKDIMHNL